MDLNEKTPILKPKRNKLVIKWCKICKSKNKLKEGGRGGRSTKTLSVKKREFDCVEIN